MAQFLSDIGAATGKFREASENAEREINIRYKMIIDMAGVNSIVPTVTPLPLGILTIPVVVHVVYGTPEENISDKPIESQIVVLNDDYQAKK